MFASHDYPENSTAHETAGLPRIGSSREIRRENDVDQRLSAQEMSSNSVAIKVGVPAGQPTRNSNLRLWNHGDPIHTATCISKIKSVWLINAK
jgi:hypothetical protein